MVLRTLSVSFLITLVALATTLPFEQQNAAAEDANRHAAKVAARPNQVLYDYLGDPVAPPDNMHADYTEKGLTRTVYDAAKAADISLTRVEVDDSEFPFLIGVECAKKGDTDTLKEQIRTLESYSLTGSVSNDTKMVTNLVPYSAFPRDDVKQILRRMMLREAVFYDRMTR